MKNYNTRRSQSPDNRQYRPDINIDLERNDDDQMYQYEQQHPNGHQPHIELDDLDLDVEQDDGMASQQYLNSENANRSVITQSPSRYGGQSMNGGGMQNHTNFQPVSASNNLMSKYNQQQEEEYQEQQQKQKQMQKGQQAQQQRHQYYDPRKEPPIYVPPFLVNHNNQAARHANRHNKFHMPQDYLPWSIVNIFICVIIALPALFFSVQTRDMKRAGNIKKAKMNSKRSLVLNIIASVVGLVTILSAVILRFALYQLFVESDVRSQSVPLIAGG